MKTMVSVESFEEMAARKAARAVRLAAGERIRPEKRITFESPIDLFSCITPERIRLIEAARETPRSISELAKTLKRQRAAVHRDVKALADYGLIALRKEKNPGHGQIQLVTATAQAFTVTAKF
jgi:predicted transcriptional regulator